MDARHLAHMATQIARNFAVQGEDAAIAATVRHIRDFWDPRMKSAICGAEGLELDPVAAKAVERLKTEYR